MPPPRCLALLTVAALLGAADDDAPPRGMDVIPLVKKAVELVTPAEPPVAGRPWSDDLAALTDPDPSVNGPAVGRLAKRGSAVLADLALIANDRDWQVRLRVVRVGAGIGGEDAAPLVLRLSRDDDLRVRRLAIIALGRCRGEPVLARLLELLASLDGDERQTAAPSLAAFGDTRAIRPLCRLRADPDAPARQAQAAALRDLVRRSDAVPVVVPLLRELRGEERRALLEALDSSLDVRLCPVYTELIAEREALIALLAVRGLAYAGDARAVPALTTLAASDRLPELREAAAATLRVLTPYRAAPGQAWTLWWQDNAKAWSRLASRDALIAELYDPAAALPTGLAAWQPEELGILIDLALPTRAVPGWVPGRALACMRTQDAAAWATAIAKATAIQDDHERRLELLVLLDVVGGPQARTQFEELLRALDEREKATIERWRTDKVTPPDLRAERALIRQALARQP
jgi:HEAT repeat protein